MAKESKQHAPHFEHRFNIEVGIDEAHNRFINRVTNMLEQGFEGLMLYQREGHYKTAMYNAATKLGMEHSYDLSFRDYVGNRFYNCLIMLEAVYEVFAARTGYEAERLSNIIQYAISLSETDLGIEWRDGVFWPAGAKLLDEALVNENIKWLADKGYQDVLVPFEKGLRHFLEAMQKPERLADTVTDVYEAVEALAKRVTGLNRELSANAELFISKLNLSEHYKKMLKDYTKYANDYRHAAKLDEGKKPLSRNEVEAFIYTSGLFIRLAVQQSA